MRPPEVLSPPLSAAPPGYPKTPLAAHRAAPRWAASPSAPPPATCCPASRPTLCMGPGQLPVEFPTRPLPSPHTPCLPAIARALSGPSLTSPWLPPPPFRRRVRVRALVGRHALVCEGVLSARRLGAWQPGAGPVQPRPPCCRPAALPLLPPGGARCRDAQRSPLSVGSLQSWSTCASLSLVAVIDSCITERRPAV